MILRCDLGKYQYILSKILLQSLIDKRLITTVSGFCFECSNHAGIQHDIDPLFPGYIFQPHSETCGIKFYSPITAH